MMTKFLALNGGSSSLKYLLYEVSENEKKVVASGNIQKVGCKDAEFQLKYDGKKIEEIKPIYTHAEAVEILFKELVLNGVVANFDDIKGVGHRILTGGTFYDHSVIIDDSVIENLTSLEEAGFGPLHLPGELSIIEAIKNKFPNISQTGSFDTGFHQTIPEENYLYAIPYKYYSEYGIRKYGFHGLSYTYITKLMQEKLNKKDVNLIVCHLGSGASICAIHNGKSLDTSMGFTPLDGLTMGTRSGSIDPEIIRFLVENKGMSLTEIFNCLNFDSGFIGLSGSNDIRGVIKSINEGNKLAKIVFDKFSGQVANYIVTYHNMLKQFIDRDKEIDGIIFTAGIGENSAIVRKDILSKIYSLNITLNDKENEQIAGFLSRHSGLISSEDSQIPVYVEPTNEEIVILDDMLDLLGYSKKKTDGKVKRLEK